MAAERVCCNDRVPRKAGLERRGRATAGITEAKKEARRGLTCATTARARRIGRLERGPFDIIGDVHGCFLELVDLLARLGYVRAGGGLVASRKAGKRCSRRFDRPGTRTASAPIMLVEGMVRRRRRRCTCRATIVASCIVTWRRATSSVQHGLETTVRELEAPAWLASDGR